MYAGIITGMAVNSETTERIITPMPKGMVAAVDDYRFANRIASRAEAIRRLIEVGLSVQPAIGRAPAKVKKGDGASR